jgi:hypothetical protein
VILNTDTKKADQKMTTYASISSQEIFNANQALTLKKAKQLVGKTIACTSSEYKGNNPVVTIFRIMDIASEWDLATQEVAPGYNNRQDYWKSFMTIARITELQSTFRLIGEDGRAYFRAHSALSHFEEPTFSGSDADREVFFIETI